MCLASLLELASYGRSSRESCAGCGRGDDGSRAPRSAGDRRAQHGGNGVESVGQFKEREKPFPSRDLELPMDEDGWVVEKCVSSTSHRTTLLIRG